MAKARRACGSSPVSLTTWRLLAFTFSSPFAVADFSPPAYSGEEMYP